MDQDTNLMVGQLVKSMAGRDKGDIQIVVKIVDDSHVLVVDGRKRKLGKPKKKKVKHLKAYRHIFTEVTEKKELLDAHIRKLLYPFQIKTKSD